MSAPNDNPAAELRRKLLRKQYYAIFMTPPEPMDDPISTMGATLKDHLEWLSDLEARGVLFASGPFRDEAGAWIGDGMAIVRAASLAEAEAMAAAEPFQKAGLRRNTVRGWQLNEGAITLTVRFMNGEFELG